jgi:hypothetical protein
MATKKKTAPTKKRAAGLKRTGAKTRALAVKRLLLKVEKKMATDAVKATLGDYIKLIQLSKDMTEEPKTDITVTWIEEPLIDI